MTKPIAFFSLLLGWLALTGEARAQQPLRWGMDETGGAPYIYDNKTKGFEVDLAAYLAQQLGRTSQPVSADWSKLPELLKRRGTDGIDIVLNGYEYSKQYGRNAPLQASIPYYVYRLTLTVHRDETAIRGWSDLPGKRVGVLSGSAADRYLVKEFGGRLTLLRSDDVANAFDLVARKKNLDATVQDNPASIYYVATDSGGRLKTIAQGREPNFYVILTRAEDVGLRNQINEALRRGIKDGTLRAIYRKYDLWNADQERLWYWADQPWPPEEAEKAEENATTEADWGNILWLLLSAAWTTIQLAFLSFPLALALGLCIALLRVYGPSWLAAPAAVYVEVVRGTPLLLQLWVLFYLIPQIVPFLALSPFQTGVLGLALNYAAYEAEIYRAGLLAIPRGQLEAAQALGMQRGTALRRIIVPQAVRLVIPPVTNDFIALFKDTSVCSVILITELTRQYNVLYNNHRDLILPIALLTATLYLLMSYPLSLGARRLEDRSRTEKGGRH